MKKLMVATMALLVSTCVSHAVFDWGATYYFYESDGTTLLNSDPSSSLGAYVQLILDVDGDGLGPCVNTGTGIQAGDDDIVFMGTWIGAATPITDGRFCTRIVSAGLSESNKWFYSRVWNQAADTWNGNDTAIAGQSSVMYWQSSGFQYEHKQLGDQAFNFLNMNPNVQGNTVNTPIPEPASFVLALAGLLLVRKFRK